MRDILRVGAVSSIVSLSTNVSIATATGLAGLIGPAAVAGYGTRRLDGRSPHLA